MAQTTSPYHLCYTLYSFDSYEVSCTNQQNHYFYRIHPPSRLQHRRTHRHLYLKLFIMKREPSSKTKLINVPERIFISLKLEMDDLIVRCIDGSLVLKVNVGITSLFSLKVILFLLIVSQKVYTSCMNDT